MSKTNPKQIDLALQGGGSHGAITWGVLNRLLEDDRLAIEGISGTSAGALNAVIVADGLHRGGRDGAREALHGFWHAVSDAGRFSPIQRSFWDKLGGNFSLDKTPSYLFFESLSQVFTPGQLNPFAINPLRNMLSKHIDFDRINAPESIKIYVTATNVRTGRPHIFRQPHLSVDTVMASACLPTMFDAVAIDGESYWDGGYSGNPALYPLVDDCLARDLMVVLINPLVRQMLPETAGEITNRVNEITFNSSLIKDLRSIYLLHQLIDAEDLELDRYRDMRLHLIHCEEDVQGLSASSKLNTEWLYLTQLRDTGWSWADDWLAEHYDALGEESTFDLDTLFENAIRPLHHVKPAVEANRPQPGR